MVNKASKYMETNSPYTLYLKDGSMYKPNHVTLKHAHAHTH